MTYGCELAVLLAAIAAVETGHLRDPEAATGDGGSAVGPLQIRQPALDDANRILPRPFALSDCRRRAVADIVAQAYLQLHAATDAGELTEDQAVLYCARIWNGGPAGNRKKSTTDYAARVLNLYLDIKRERNAR